MICGQMDAELGALAREFGCACTRYSDDITFSSNHPCFPTALAVVSREAGGRVTKLGVRLKTIIRKNGFEINERKTRLLTPSDRQTVTGLTVNEYANVPRDYVRNLRAVLHAWDKYGLEAVSDKFFRTYECRDRQRVDFESVIFGRVQYVGHVRGFDSDLYRRLRDAFHLLRDRRVGGSAKTADVMPQSENALVVHRSPWVMGQRGAARGIHLHATQSPLNSAP
jgi:RNA-directed DNA polymerase